MSVGFEAPSRPAAALTERLIAEDFADLVGADPEHLPEACRAILREHDFGYVPLPEHEREALLLEILRAIDDTRFLRVGSRAYWEDTWTTVRTGDAETLLPDYLRAREFLRLNGQYVRPLDPAFQLHWYDAFLEYLFRAYCADASVVYEFGAGSGINLVKFARIDPGKRYVGLDWAKASVDLVNELGRRHGWALTGRRFDFFDPDVAFPIEEGAVVLTVGALEQTGQRWGPFLDYLLRFRPAACLHVEPIVEWYDGSTLFDYAAIRYHRARGYWEGFHERLLQLEDAGRVEVIGEHRSNLGTLYIDGYSQLIWRPL